jgi:hypothetical protein
LGGAFCTRCGQKVAPLDPSFYDFVHDFTHELLDVDGRIFNSVRKLLLSPGFLTREHFEGRRASWISPIRLYLIFSIAYFAITSLAPAHALPVAGNEDSDPEAIIELQRLGFENLRALEEAIEGARAHWAPRLMFLLVPLNAWLVGLAWRRRRRNYPQHLYFALHVHAAWFAAGALVAAARLAAPSIVPRSLDTLALLYGFVYAMLAFRLAYGATLSQAVMRMTAVLGIYFVVVVIASVGTALAVIFGHA